jgi:hypothetical protein
VVSVRFALVALMMLVVVGSGACNHVSPVTAPTRSSSSLCPSQAPLDPGPDAQTGATAAAVAAVPERYGSLNTSGFQVTSAAPASPTSGFGAIAFTLCGATVGQRTWVVELSFPAELPSQDLSAGQLFLCRFPNGWAVWYQYH